MKKYIKLLLVVLILCLGLVTITGCNKENKKEETTSTNEKVDSKVIGTWEWNESSLTGTYVFKKDGTGTYTLKNDNYESVNNLTYETKDNTLYITYEDDDVIYELPYKFKDNNLVITDSLGEDVIYKQK